MKSFFSIIEASLLCHERVMNYVKRVRDQQNVFLTCFWFSMDISFARNYCFKARLFLFKLKLEFVGVCILLQKTVP